jgi:hypothetical protein
MTIIEKIYYRSNAFYFLETNQYLQLLRLNLLILAPYYKERLIQQSKIVAENENFKNVFGRSRYECENNIN